MEPKALKLRKSLVRLNLDTKAPGMNKPCVTENNYKKYIMNIFGMKEKHAPFNFMLSA